MSTKEDKNGQTESAVGKGSELDAFEKEIAAAHALEGVERKNFDIISYEEDDHKKHLYHKSVGWRDWLEYRFPVVSFLKHLEEYQTPKDLSYMWNLGSCSGIALVIQIVTGIMLAVHYVPSTDAFESVNHIMRNITYGWLIRYGHAVGATMFFGIIYVHIARGIYYGTYKYPREFVWILGCMIFVLMMASGFLGYVLPDGQMGYWGATVITNLFSAIPYIGEYIVVWIWGDFSVSELTLMRFYAFHFVIPIAIIALVMIQLTALHRHGSTSPSGAVPIHGTNTIPFHPYYTIKDYFGFGVYFIIYAYIVFFAPNAFNHPDNYILANPMSTPEHIVPEWYFLPFYAILRSIPSKLGGVIMMLASVGVLFFLPWLDSSNAKTPSKRCSYYRPAFWGFCLSWCVLLYVGAEQPTEPYVSMGRVATLYYFGYFLVLLPVMSKIEKRERMFG